VGIDDLNDREIDMLLNGRPPRDDLGEVAEVVASLRADAAGPLDETVAADHMRAVAVELTPEVAPIGARRRHMAAAVLAGAASFVLASGGLAAADMLPDRAQEVVADAGDAIGLNLPSPDDDHASVVTDKDQADEDGEEPAAETPAASESKSDSEADEKDASEATGGSEADGEHPDNHGAVVSDAAKDHADDEACGNHGRAVSAVAQGEAECTPPPGEQQNNDEADAPEDEAEEHRPDARPTSPTSVAPGGPEAPGRSGDTPDEPEQQPEGTPGNEDDAPKHE
jgi:hypothetical protein